MLLRIKLPVKKEEKLPLSIYGEKNEENKNQVKNSVDFSKMIQANIN